MIGMRKVHCMVCKSVEGLRPPVFIKDGNGMFLFVMCTSCFNIVSKEEN